MGMFLLTYNSIHNKNTTNTKLYMITNIGVRFGWQPL